MKQTKKWILFRSMRKLHVMNLLTRFRLPIIMTVIKNSSRLNRKSREISFWKTVIMENGNRFHSFDFN